MNLDNYRNSPLEQQRTSNLLALMPELGANVLDVGARDGYFSQILSTRFPEVVALDLTSPRFRFPRVSPVVGDVSALSFANDAFDLVFCAEVLEHVPSPRLEAACSELARVTHRLLLIGVPFRQDLRVGRTKCRICQRINPPWGHVNSFDLDRLCSLFPALRLEKHSLVGSHREVTNALSAALMNLAGNPFGTYEQDEPCIYCGGSVGPAPDRNLAQHALTRAACVLNNFQRRFETPRPSWIHVLFRKN